MKCIVIGLVAAALGAQSFRLEQILGSGFPTELTAAPAGGVVAWVTNARGVRNVWVAEGPDYKGRAVTAYAADDGQEITNLSFTPDGKTLVYVRGGDANRAGDIPNPANDATGAEQAVWTVGVAGGAPRKIGEGRGVVVAPTGARVAFTGKGQIWIAGLESGEKPAAVAKPRGGSGSLKWSPDGTKLAFVSNRGDHSFIGVYDTVSKGIRYLDPSVDGDSSPVWSPDSRQVAFLRTPASREMKLFAPQREGEPWSIRVADVATGRSREIWRAARGRGSVFREIVSDSMIQWVAGDRLVFPWERDGWTHLYSVPADGGEATLLTPGDFEVEDVRLSPDRKYVLLNSNQDDIDRRHLWRVAASGGRVEPLPKGNDIEWSPVMTADGKALAYLASGAKTPAHPLIRVNGGAPRRLMPAAADFPEQALVEPQAVIINATDGMKVHAQLFLPANLKPGERRPAAIFLHGGSRRQMLLGFNYSIYYHNAYALSQYLVSKGYIALSVNYRSGIGYGMEFREALNYGATGASEFQDVQGAGLYLRGRPDVDARRIALWGGSYGGNLTAMGLSRASDLFAAGVDIHGAHDWNRIRKGFVPSYDPGTEPEVARLAFASSPMASVKTWRSPVLLIHGDDDRNVPFNESVRLAEALRKQGVEFEQLVFPDEVHSFLRYESWLRAFGAAVDFLERKLQ